MTIFSVYLHIFISFLLYHFIRSKYTNTEIVFVSHDTEGYEVNEEQFFTRGNSGGTMVSSGLSLVQEIIGKRFHPSAWNIYIFQCSDGDNFSMDTSKTLEIMNNLKVISQLVGYCEIAPESDPHSSWFDDSKLSIVYKPLIDKKFRMSSMASKKDVWPAFSKFFGGK